MFRALAESQGCEIYHLHGLWSPVLHRAARTAAGQGVPYVVSTRGMLAGWAIGHKALKKKVAWRLYQRNDLQAAACLLASSRFEQQDVERLVPGKNVEIIPNGCSGPPDGFVSRDALPGGNGARWALALGRLHPVKGYAELIDAWAAVKPAGWKLAIAGPDEDGYRSVLERRISQHGLGGEVRLLGAVDDGEKWSLFGQCELYLAPSRTENFGMAIAEALLAGRPVITTKGTPWQELVEHSCGWWIELGAGPLEAALAEATGSTADELAAMGDRGRRLVREKYTWRQVAARTIDVYKRYLGQGG